MSLLLDYAGSEDLVHLAETPNPLHKHTMLKAIKAALLNRKEWRDVYIEIIAAGVLALITAFGLPHLGPSLNFLTTSHALDGWLLILLGASTAIWFLSLVTRFLIPRHTWRYRSDEWDGIIWKWEYENRRAINVQGFCKECGTELIFTERREGESQGTDIFCTWCNSGSTIVNAFDVPDHARRKVNKVIDDGSWQQRPGAN